MSGAEYLLLMERVSHALNAIDGFICSRPCCYDSLNSCQGYHTYVGLSKHIHNGKQVSEDQILKYENSVKHGVIHSVLCYVIACVTNPELADKIHDRIHNKNLDTLKNNTKKSNSPLEAFIPTEEFRTKENKIAHDCFNNPIEEEKILVSCLVHDFLKCSSGHVDHDKRLKEFFPDIDPVTFHHSAPTEEMENHPLIMADRLELLRFKDAKDWLDEDKVFKTYNNSQINLIELFYNIVRPVLEKSHLFRDERWIRHGLEKHISGYEFEENYPSFFMKIKSPPEGFKAVLDDQDDDDFWSVELSKGSMGECIVGQERIKEDYEAGWQEINGFFSWELVQGKIPLKEYKAKTGKTLNINIMRDHFFASGSLPTKDWIFTHKNINSKMIEKMLDNNLHFCHENIVKKFLKTCNKVIDVFYAIKMQ